MKLKQFYTLASLTLLFGAFTANAQTASLNATAGPFDNLAHDCVSKSPSGSEVLLLNSNDVVSQTFIACTEGEIQKVYVMVKQTSGEGQLSFAILDKEGNLMGKTNVVMKDGDSGLAVGKLLVKVEDGRKYTMNIAARGDVSFVIEGRYTAEPGVDLYLNGWKLDGTITTALGMKHINEIDQVQGDRNSSNNNQLDARSTELAATFLTYPNPFTEDFTIEFTKELKGKTQVVLLDLTGNVMHRQIHTDLREGDQVNINPRYSLNPGAYAVRIMNNNLVFNKTVMKN
jgi:hypothetical protein